MKRWLAVLLAFFVVGANVAHAQQFAPFSMDSGNYTRAGSAAGRCSCRVLGANACAPFVFSTYQTNGPTAAGARPICYPWGTQTVFTASDQATFFWTLTTSVTAGTQSTAQRTYLTASSAQGAYPFSGDGVAFTLNGAGSWSNHPNYATMHGSKTSSTSGGYKPGICAGTYGQRPSFLTGTRAYDRRMPFCGADADCTEAGLSGGTCSTTTDATGINTETEVTDAVRNGCAFAMACALNASTEVCACPER